MRTISTLLALVLASQASAAVVYDQTIVPTKPNGSTEYFDDDNDFSVAFDFSGAAYTSIDSFTMTVEYDQARDESFSFGLTFYEDWSFRVQGSTTSGPLASADDLFTSSLTSNNGSFSVTVDAADDSFLVDAFAHSVASQEFEVWLSENSSDIFINNPSVKINSVRLVIEGEAAPTPAVPLPAGFPLALAGLGAFGIARQMRKS